MVSMIVVGRIIHRVDPRYLVVLGLCLTAYSLYVMTGFTPQMDSYLIIETGIVQGLGLGLVFVPLSTVAFATLDPRFRTDAASLFSLVRNLGSSIGISIVTVVLSRNIQINHAHGNREYRSRMHPIWKKQNPHYGENYPNLIKYKGKNKYKLNPY